MNTTKSQRIHLKKVRAICKALSQRAKQILKKRLAFSKGVQRALPFAARMMKREESAYDKAEAQRIKNEERQCKKQEKEEHKRSKQCVRIMMRLLGRYFKKQIKDLRKNGIDAPSRVVASIDESIDAEILCPTKGSKNDHHIVESDDDTACSGRSTPKSEHYIVEEGSPISWSDDDIVMDDFCDVLEATRKILNDNSGDIDCDPNYIVQGQKKKGKTAAQKKNIARRLHAEKTKEAEEKNEPAPLLKAQKKAARKALKRFVMNQQIDEEMERRGFIKTEDHSGQFTQYTYPMPPKIVAIVKDLLRDIVFDSLFDSCRGQEGSDLEAQNKTVRHKIDMALGRIYQQIRSLEKTAKSLSNLQFSYSYKLGDVQRSSPSLVEFVLDIIGLCREYQHSDHRYREIDQALRNISLSFLTTRDKVPLTKGQFMQTIIDSAWYIVNPNTKTHCVADCLAILEVYRNASLQLSSIWGYVKRQGQQIANEHGIQKGATVQQIKQLAEKYSVNVVFNCHEDRDEWDCDAYLIIFENHCYIALNPENPRSKLVFDLSERFNREQQREMEVWEPTEKFIYPASYDFEWVVDGDRHVPYAFGIFHSDDQYHQHLSHEGIYDAFISNLYDSVVHIYDDSFVPEFETKWFKKNEEKGKKKQSISKMADDRRATKMIVNIFAHNGHKCDYPIVEKALLNNSLFQMTGQCASGMAKISYTYRVLGRFVQDQVYVQFTDSMNLYRGELDEFGKAMGLAVQKQQCDHSVIKLNNYASEIQRQNIGYYLQMDCEVLYKAMIKYDSVMKQELGWSFLKNNVLTGTSMAEKIYFGKYYKGGLYTMADDMANYCRRAYKGGLTDTFRTGIFDRVISADINSSYPHQMTKAPLPVGKSFMITINRPYSGEPLLEGIYRVVVKSTPMNLLYPCLGDIIDGKLCFSHWQNHEMSITKEELVYAFGEGYQFHILDACVCERTSDIYHDYIFGAYEERRELKKKMAQAKQDGDMVAYTKYNIAQETQKLKMNGTYGKLGWSKRHDVSNYVTADTKFLLEQFAQGNIKSISKINERYTSYSGVQVSNASRTNFMLAAYITARGRLQLCHALRQFDRAGYEVLYSDTDSIYANITDSVTQESFNRYVKPLLDDDKLGAFKLEMPKNVGENEAIGCFVSLKLYALKGPTTGKEKITARGIMQWMIGNEEKHVKRRQQEGSDEVNFDSIASLLQGMPLEVTRQQAFIRKDLLKSDVDNIKIQRECTSVVTGAITKKIVTEDGLCRPMHHLGQVEVPIQKTFTERWLQFPKIEPMELHFDSTFDDIASRYCVIRHQVMNVYVVFIDESSIPEYLERFNSEHVCHQMFGKWIQPSFDIDCKIYEGETIDMDMPTVLKRISTKLNIESDRFQVVDRSREVDEGIMKYSYHIRAKDFCIQRQELQHLVRDLIAEDAKRKTRSLLSYLDGQIYRSKGSLRISDNAIYYRTQLFQLSYYSYEHAKRDQTIKDRQGNKVTGSLDGNLQTITEEYLRNNNIAGWSYRSAKTFKTCTIVNLNRSTTASSECTICKTRHEKDNYLFLKMKTGNSKGQAITKIEQCCLKNRSN